MKSLTKIGYAHGSRKDKMKKRRKSKDKGLKILRGKETWIGDPGCAVNYLKKFRIVGARRAVP
jgi:hypothetical protein